MNAKTLKILEEIVKDTPYDDNKRILVSTIEDVLKRHDKSWTRLKQENFEIRCGIRYTPKFRNPTI